MNNDMKEEETEKNIQNIHKKINLPPPKKKRQKTDPYCLHAIKPSIAC